MRSLTVPALFTAAILAAGCADAPTAGVEPGKPNLAHESNNRSGLSGTQNGNAITGNAIINYVAGQEGWRSTVTLQGVLAPGTYTFFAIGPGGVQPVCSFTVDASGGRQGCSADTDLGGFARAEVRYQDGTVVASGTFERRGGKREK